MGTEWERTVDSVWSQSLSFCYEVKFEQEGSLGLNLKSCQILESSYADPKKKFSCLVVADAQPALSRLILSGDLCLSVNGHHFGGYDFHFEEATKKLVSCAPPRTLRFFRSASLSVLEVRLAGAPGHTPDATFALRPAPGGGGAPPLPPGAPPLALQLTALAPGAPPQLLRLFRPQGHPAPAHGPVLYRKRGPPGTGPSPVPAAGAGGGNWGAGGGGGGAGGAGGAAAGGLDAAAAAAAAAPPRAKREASSRYVGVYKDRGKWTVQIAQGGRQHYLGRYPTEEDAAAAYAIAAEEIKEDGEFQKRRSDAPGDRRAVGALHLAGGRTIPLARPVQHPYHRLGTGAGAGGGPAPPPAAPPAAAAAQQAAAPPPPGGAGAFLPHSQPAPPAAAGGQCPPPAAPPPGSAGLWAPTTPAAAAPAASAMLPRAP